MLSLLYKKNIHFTFPRCHIQLQDPFQCPGPLVNIQSPPMGPEDVSHGLATYKLNFIHTQHSYTMDKKKEDFLKGLGESPIWKSGETQESLILLGKSKERPLSWDRVSSWWASLKIPGSLLWEGLLGPQFSMASGSALWVGPATTSSWQLCNSSSYWYQSRDHRSL